MPSRESPDWTVYWMAPGVGVAAAAGVPTMVAPGSGVTVGPAVGVRAATAAVGVVAMIAGAD
jgi:hypothetical protein